MLFVYGDESMDETKQRVCAVAGIVGTEEIWAAIQTKWIDRTGGIPFHANDCDSDYGDYKNTPHADNKALYRDLAIMLAESGLAGFGQAIDLKAKEAIFPGGSDLAYFNAFIRVLEAMRNFAINTKETLEITFDMRLESEHNAGLLYGYARESDQTYTACLASKISFEFAKDNPRIQVADLLAREAMKALDNFVGPVKRPIRKSWKALADTNRFDVAAFSTEWFSSMKQQYAEVQKIVGFNQNDYVQWLKDRNRQDSISNKFHFITWIARRDKEQGK